MKAIAECIKGLESIAIDEIKEILKIKGEKILDGKVEIKLSRIEDLERLANEGRCLKRIYLLLDAFKFKRKEEIKKRAKNIDFSKFIKGKFRVSCSIEDSNIISREIEKLVGDVIEGKVDLENPDTTVYVDIKNDKCFIGILNGSENLARREYKVRTSSSSLNANVAASAVRLAKLKEEEIVVDPFCRDGVLLIEACLKYNVKGYGFDENKGNIISSRINAKLAKVNANIVKEGVDWLDTKFKKQEADVILTKPIFTSKNRENSYVEKELNELFNQAKFILKKDGRIVLVSRDVALLKKIAKRYKFRLTKKIDYTLGDSRESILVFKKV